MRRTPRKAGKIATLARNLKELLQFDLSMTMMAARHSTPRAQKILCAPVLFLISLVEQYGPEL